MSREELLAMARKADFDGWLQRVMLMAPEVLERFAALVAAAERETMPALIARAKQEAVAAHITMFGDVERDVADEREACAQVCEKYGTSVTTKDCAAAIRERSQP